MQRPLSALGACKIICMSAGRKSKQPRTAFGERLCKARIESHLSQEQVADAMGLSQNSYTRWERIPVKMTSLQIEKVASVVNTTAPELFGGHPGPEKPGVLLARKWRKLLQAISKLPEEEQEKYYEAISALARK
jgi:transcriptional regulator with XRE-family HTH domain